MRSGLPRMISALAGRLVHNDVPMRTGASRQRGETEAAANRLRPAEAAAEEAGRWTTGARGVAASTGDPPTWTARQRS
jgi:hypothetical protein